MFFIKLALEKSFWHAWDMENEKKLVVLDGNALMHRAYHAIRPLTTADGTFVHAVFGFVSMVISILEVENPDYFIVAFDTAAKTFRKEKNEDYKAGRVKPSNDFYDQIPLIHEFVRRLGMTKLECDGFEADDILATITHQVGAQTNLKTVLVTSDKDALQLVNDKVVVHDLRGGYKKAKTYDSEAVRAKFGVSPAQFVDYKAIMGDPSDNLPGVAGIGPKGAAILLQKYDDLEGIYKNINELKDGEKERLINGKNDAYFTREMAQLRHDVPIEFNLSNHSVKNLDADKAVEYLKELDFKTLNARLYNWAHKPEEVKSEDLPEMMEEEKKEKPKKKGVDENQLSLF